MRIEDEWESIRNNIVEGSSLPEEAKRIGLSYGQVFRWINEGDRRKEYEESLVGRGEWFAQRLLTELRRVGLSDIRSLYHSNGEVKDPGELTEDEASMLKGFTIDSVTGKATGVSVVDKLKSLEMLGKHLKMFTDKVQVEGKLSLEELVVGSMEADKEADD